MQGNPPGRSIFRNDEIGRRPAGIWMPKSGAALLRRGLGAPCGRKTEAAKYQEKRDGPEHNQRRILLGQPHHVCRFCLTYQVFDERTVKKV